jgi:gamma-glutamyltranspeptidase/glutathione hydrolase
MPHGRAPAIGELFRFEAAAKALRHIAKHGVRAYYEGEIAEAIARHAQQHGGAMCLADLANYRPEWVTPISQSVPACDGQLYDLHEIPPNGQGIGALMAMGILNHLDLPSQPVDGVQSQHLQIEAMKLAFADVYQYVADPRSMGVSPAQMLDPAYLADRAKLINPNKASHFDFGLPPTGGTIYLTTSDEQGRMVSFIQSNYMGFGSGIVVPEFGISLQNRGYGFSMDPKLANVVAGGKRPFHTIIPAFLTKQVNGKTQAQMSFGVMGGDMQPQGHVQTLVRMLDYGQNPQAACDAPRWRFNTGLNINVEAAMNGGTVQELMARGHQLDIISDSYQDFGAGQFIWRMGDPAVQGYQAASDPRRDGQAVGF